MEVEKFELEGPLLPFRLLIDSEVDVGVNVRESVSRSI